MINNNKIGTDKVNKNKQLAKNTVALYVRMFVTMVVTLYTSRIVLAALGVEDFGIYSIVGGIVSMFSFLDVALYNTTMRYVTFEMGKGEAGDVRRVFSACVTLYLLIGVVILLFAETVGLFILNNYLVIPPERMWAAQWVYQVTVLSFVVSVLCSPYNGAIVAYERMTTFAYISIFEVMFKLIIAYMIVHNPFDRLVFYAVMMFVAHALARLSQYVYCRWQFPATRFRLVRDGTLYRSISGFTGWTMLNSIGTVLCTQGMSIILNIFFGPVVSAARGIALQVENTLTAFFRNFMTAVKPQMTKSYSEEDMPRFEFLLMFSSKGAFFILSIMAFPLLLNTSYVMHLWLGNVPEPAVDFVRIAILATLVNALAEPLLIGVSANGNIKNFQMVSSFILLSMLPVAWVLLHVVDMPIIVYCVYSLFTLLTFFYKMVVGMRLFSLPLGLYLSKVIARVVAVSLVGSVVYIAYSRYVQCSDFFTFVVSSLLAVVYCCAITYALGLNGGERRRVMEIAGNAIRKLKK